ncbi:MAG: hypothetical protein LBS54_05870 [Dysgonamonadaceae bacterium]|nr:hypothetical protein [Dysgonamonadaceae bacterium]
MKKNFSNYLKPVKVILIMAVLAGYSGCDDKSPEEEAEEAAVFMCDCMGGSSSQSKLDDCIEKMKKKFNDWGTNTFLETFNSVNECGIELYRTTATTNDKSPTLKTVSAKQTDY